MLGGKIKCNGYGSCLNQCECICTECSQCGLNMENCKCECHCNLDECSCYSHNYNHVCTCDHRDHRGECKPKDPCPHNCEPLPCPNYKNHDNTFPGYPVNKMYPEWFLSVHGGNCIYCGMLYGHGFKNTDKIKECPVCYDDKPMTKLRCGHDICWDCWSTMCNIKSKNRTSCPLCRCKKW